MSDKITYHKMIQAIQKSDLVEVEKLLDQGAKANYQNYDYHDTFLLQAAKQGDLDIVKLLVARGADVNQKIGNHITTPLHQAVYYNYFDVATYLLEQGAKADQENVTGSTPLLFICSNDSTSPSKFKIIQALVAAGANVNHQDMFGQVTPVMSILNAMSYQFHIVKFLAEQGYDYSLTNFTGQTALELARAYKREDAVVYLESYQKTCDEQHHLKQLVDTDSENHDKPLIF